MKTFQEFQQNIRSGKLHPVYCFHGEEGWFIDQLEKSIREHGLPESAKAFNEFILYGKEVNAQSVLDIVSRYPMLSDRQVVILKEAQSMSDLTELERYIINPVPSTVFVICHKNKKVDGRTTFARQLNKHAAVFESKSASEKELPALILQFFQKFQCTPAPGVIEILIEYIGNDLYLLEQEIEKLSLRHGVNATITVNQITENIGLHREYNIFEFQKALGSGNIPLCARIMQGMKSDYKSTHDLLPVLGALFRYFRNISIVQNNSALADKELANALGLNSTFFLSEYKQAARLFPQHAMPKIFTLLSSYDLKAKGVEFTGSVEELYREFMVKLMHYCLPTASLSPA